MRKDATASAEGKLRKVTSRTDKKIARKKYRCCVSWKWFNFLYELCLVFSTLNFIMYLVLDSHRKEFYLQILLTNMLAFFCMLIEFFIINTIPFIHGHSTLVILFVLLYIVMHAIVFIIIH